MRGSRSKPSRKPRLPSQRMSKTMNADDRHILDVLARERRWLSFDKLYDMAQCDREWTDFALRLERLVKQGAIEYTLSYGMDVGYYRIKG